MADDRALPIVAGVLLALLWLTLLLPAVVFNWLIREEHPIEAVGALSLLGASMLSLLCWRRLQRAPQSPRLLKLVFLALALRKKLSGTTGRGTPGTAELANHPIADLPAEHSPPAATSYGHPSTLQAPPTGRKRQRHQRRHA